MNLNEFLEQPLPIIKIDTEKIAINMNDKTEGYISIKNIGGGLLCGQIISNTECILLEQDSFCSNDINIKYSLASSVYSNGEFIKSSISIVSNGGEINIPLYITISNFEFLNCGEEKIYDIKEFYHYYLKNYLEAIRIFYSYDFMIWLKRINFKHIDVVEEILQDANKQRAIDNFFILCKLKEKASLKILQTSFKYKYTKNDENMFIEGYIPLKLIGNGYFEETIIKPFNSDFIKLDMEKITNKDFDEDNNLNLKFIIDKSKVNNYFERKKLLFDKAKENVIIELSEKLPVETILERQYFNTTDNGVLKVINNTNKELIIEIIPKDTFVIFSSKKYLIEKFQNINFNIKLSGFLKAQMDFTKKPNLESEILIKVILDDEIYKFEKTIYVGNSLI